ncbi:MAG: amidase [Gammaproteobacteria bacterium]|nr:amidase [Gammaproteobacteria bacterium]
MALQMRWGRCLLAALTLMSVHLAVAAGPRFQIEEATLAQIQQALRAGQLSTVDLVNAYLQRIKAYNGACVSQPEGLLGRTGTIVNAGQINALSTLNLRPATRRIWGFPDHNARSMTDPADTDASMPDALEVAAAHDRQLAQSGALVGPLHGMVLAIKDQFDTRDLRTTSGADAPYANDRPPLDSTFVTRLRQAGAIILAKANMGEYASGDRSSFGGVFCNPYDTERSPGRSSGGSASSVAANLVTCAIGEESGPSVRNPAKNNNVVGLAPTQELVSRAGMIRASFMNDRVGPMCRNVQDVALLLDAMAGFDPADELTAFAVGHMPSQSYAESARPQRLDGLKIGVVREYMDRGLFTRADEQSIAIVEAQLDVLRGLGASIVDPGAGGALFQECVDEYGPSAHGAGFVKQYPELFPVDAAGKPAADHMPLLVNMALDHQLVPGRASIRDLGGDRTVGEGRYVLELYLRQRGDANIKSVADLIEKSRFYSDIRPGTGFSDKRQSLVTKAVDQTFDISNRLQQRFALQQIVLQCMARLELDAVTYPTGNIPPPKLGAPTEPTVNGRSAMAWTLLGANGFPAISVPAGFTSEVYDRIPDPADPANTVMVGPVKARLPVGIDFLGRPFAEPVLLRIAAAYEAASHHREPPPGFGPVE